MNYCFLWVIKVVVFYFVVCVCACVHMFKDYLNILNLWMKLHEVCACFKIIQGEKNNPSVGGVVISETRLAVCPC